MHVKIHLAQSLLKYTTDTTEIGQLIFSSNDVTWSPFTNATIRDPADDHNYLQFCWDTFLIFSPGIGVIDPRMISVMSVCASGYFYLIIIISGTTYQINLKFCNLIEKAIVQITSYTS